MASRERIYVINASSRSIESFFSVSNEKVDGGEAVQKKPKEADLDGEVENEMKKLRTIFIAYILIVQFALLPQISFIVYKKGCSMSASNKLPFSFP